MRGRAFRRHHAKRLAAKRRKFERYSWLDEDEMPPDNVLANTTKACSCWMCGNPRKYHKHTGEHEYTVQERRHLQETIQQRTEEDMDAL